MYRNRYFFNPETLKFEKIDRSISGNLRRIFIYLGAVVCVSVIIRVGFEHFVTAPKLNLLKQKNQSLRTAYKSLENKITNAESLLLETQGRDDRLYRSVFNLDPVPGSVREAGFGGSQSIMGRLKDITGFEIVGNAATQLEKLATKALVQSWSLAFLDRRAEDLQNLIRSKPAIQPISPADSFWLTSSFGYRWDPFTGGRRMHSGIDLAGPIGIKIYATGGGTVVSAENSSHGYGKEVLIEHGFGYFTRYAHLQKIAVKKGEKVSRGQYIGALGNSGRSTGPHLHYEIIQGQRSVNPMHYYNENLTTSEYSRIHVNSAN